MYDVAVIGAGVMGSATARALARRGKKVVVFERFEVGHKRGSSHGASRIFRFSYPNIEYVRMAQEALPLWRDLEDESGEMLLQQVGGLDIGKAALDNEAALTQCGAACEMMTSDEVLDRFSEIHPPAGEVVLYSPDAGFIHAERAWRAFMGSAVTRGVELRENTVVTSLDVADSGVTVHTDRGAERAEVAVVTAGAWARPLLAQVGIELDVRPTRETVAYFRIPDETVPTLVEWTDPLIYALPSPGQGLKVGEHIAGPDADPDEEGVLPDRQSAMRLMDWVVHRFPMAAHAPHLKETCFYTNTSDEHFVLERHGPVVVGSPCSGHGFKFSPLIGERLADLTTL